MITKGHRENLSGTNLLVIGGTLILVALAALTVFFPVPLTAFLIVATLCLFIVAAYSLWQRNQETTFRHRLHTLLNHTNEAIQITDREGDTLVLNPVFKEWSGYDESDLAGMSPFAFVESDRPLWQSAVERLSKGEELETDLRVRRKDGSRVLARLHFTPILNAMGKFVECIVSYSDVSERWELSRKLEESQEKYCNIVESTLDGLVVVQDGRLVFVNQSAVKIFGYDSAEEMQTVNFTQTVAPASRPFVKEVELQKSTLGDIFSNYEMKGLTKQGKIIDLESNARLVSWNGGPAVLASFRDVTDRKMLEHEQALWLWEQETLCSIDRKLASIVDLQQILATVAKNAKALTRADFAAIVMVERTRSSLVWWTVRGNREAVQEEPIKMSREELERLTKKGPVVLDKHHREGFESYREAFDREGIVSAALFPLQVEGELRGHLLVGFRSEHELTGRNMRLLLSLAEKSSIAVANTELYDNLVQRERELKLLSGARVEAQEEERRRIAREIHDSLGQLLTAIKFNIEVLEDSVSSGSARQERLQDVKRLLDTAMAEAREISYNLMPSVLEDFGLVPALQLLCEQFEKRNGLRLTFHAHGVHERLDPIMEVGLYRIVQEALTNIAKHAQATEASVQFVRDTQGIRLTVEDSGKGFETVQPRLVERRGMGLVSMRERAASFKGSFTIDSTPGSGTVVVVEIPIPNGLAK